MPCVKAGSKHQEWEFETAEVIPWFAENKLKFKARAKNPFAEDADAPESIEEAERRKMIAQADKAEVQVAKEARLVVPIDEIAAVVAEENARVRARLLTLPNELRPKVLTFLAEDRVAAEQLLADAEAVVLEALGEIRSWAPGADAVASEPEVADDDSDTDS